MISRILPRSPRSMLLALAAAFVGCSTDDPGPDIRRSATVLWEDVRDSAEVIDLLENSPCIDCIKLTRIAILGDTTPDGSLTYVSSVIRDSVGRYWLGQRGHLKVFASSGELVRLVGRTGAGPLEFQDPMPVHTDSAGRVHVIDRTNARETIVASDFTLVSDGPSRLQSAFSFAPVGDGSAFFASLWSTTAQGAGLPLHIVRGDEIVASFGTPPAAGFVDALNSQRVVATDYADRLYSAPRFAYDIEVHRADGSRIVGLRGPRLNERLPTRAATNLRDNPLPSQMSALAVDREDRLWVLIKRPRSDWRSFVIERVLPDGSIGMQMRPGSSLTIDSLFRVQVDVIDLRRGLLLARTERRELLGAFLGERTLYQNFEDADGIPRLAVWTAELATKP